MRAVVVTRPGGPEVLEVRDVPEPTPGPGQVLVAVEAAGVNYRDVYEREGTPPYGAATPLVAGVEGAGTVVATGDGVTDVAAGDRVAWVQGQGSQAERVVVDAANVVPVPDGLPSELAAAVLLQGITAQYLATDTYPVQSGDWVVVHAAAGGVGLLLTQVVELRGGHVVATASTAEKAALAREAGAHEVGGYDDFVDRARDATGGEGVAAVYDGVGRTTFLRGFEALRPRGVNVLFGAASGPPEPLELSVLSRGGFFVTRPALRFYTRTREELLRRAGDVLGWTGDDTLDVRIGGRYPLEEVRRAHEDLEARRTTGKLLLIP